MYQEYYDVFVKISIYINIIRKYKDSIKEVQVSNKIEDVSGRYYCKVYVDLILKENADIGERELGYYVHTEFLRHYNKEGFSFYLGKGFYDEPEFLNNKEPEVHYNYIWNLMQWYLEADKIQVKSAPFISIKMVQYERERELVKFQERRLKIEDYTQNLPMEKEQLIAVKGWSGLRIGEITNLILPGKKQAFRLEANELKKDLSMGKVKMTYSDKTAIYALIQRDSLTKKLTKEDLITMIEKGDGFEGLIWIRPKDLWD